jgi:penicillin-binding protein 1C
MKRSIKIFIFVIVALLTMVAGSILFLPDPLFDNTYSTVLYDRNGQLMGGRVAADEQWRFPLTSDINDKFRAAILLKEDRHFYRHPGFNPVSMYHAVLDNIEAGRVVRGGSTITMQTIRLARKGKSRSIKEKLTELYLGVGLELTKSKEEILSLYSAHAPFGGNVVGLEAASWRYFGHHPNDLSWGEAALLAVLPNAPSLIHPGKNRNLLREKRDKLLHNLYEYGELDSLTLVLSLLEPLPERPLPMPQEAPHLLSRFHAKDNAKKVFTTLDGKLQQRITQIVEDHHQRLSGNEIHNAAVLVLDPETYEVIVYVANIQGPGGQVHGNQVDMIRAPRSTGSILKPLLYAAMIEEGLIMPDALVPDIPSYYDNYSPENFDLTYEGAVPASMALSRSRNVPSVYMLRDYGGLPFLHLLKNVGLTSFDKPAGHYGLTLILGGGEASLWELTNMYAGMARTLLNYDNFYSKYTGREYEHPVLEIRNRKDLTEPEVSQQVPLHAASVWLTFAALEEVKRPESEAGWEGFRSSLDIAWKTGTSYGFRDAWAIGTTPDYVVGVWVGNADGEGRDGLTGTRVAAPLMFEVFGVLNAHSSFHPPYDELEPFTVCSKSGYRASRYCPAVDTIISFTEGVKSEPCDYHQLVFTDSEKMYRYNQDCANSPLVMTSWFVLPPVQEWYYRKLHPSYQSLPPWHVSCNEEENFAALEFIYPMESAKVFVPVGVDEQRQEIVLEVTNRYPDQKVYWHLDNVFLGETEHAHQLAVVPDKGWHTVTVVNESGERNSVRFEVVGEGY